MFTPATRGWVSVCTAAALILGACTSSTNAAPVTTDDAPTVVTTDAPANPDVFAPDLTSVGVVVDLADEIQVVTSGEIVTSDGTQIAVIDLDTGDIHTLARAELLEIGVDPSQGERFGSVDVGGDRMIVFETRTGDEVPHINLLTADGIRSDVGPGSYPAIRQDGQAFAFVGPDGITVMWSPTSLLDSGHQVAGSVTSMRFSPDGSQLAVGWENEGRGGVTIFDVEANGITGNSDVAQPNGHVYQLPSWIDETHLAVLDSTASGQETGSIVTVDLETGTVSGVAALEDDIVDFDYSPGAHGLLVVTTTGEIKWVGGGATGDLTAMTSVGARW